MSEIVTYAVDCGSVAKSNFAWTCSKDRETWSKEITELVAAIVIDLEQDRRVSVGFECVLFVPCPEEPARLGKARSGDCTPETGNKPFSATAAACATMTGLPSLAWVLREVHRQAPEAVATTRWTDFTSGKARLLIWEAFVSGKEKAQPPSHHGDALLAVAAFEHASREGAPESRVTCEAPLSLAGAVILWSGMSADVSLLHQPALVLRPVTAVS